MEAVLRMAFTGRHERLSAQRAYELGICSQVVDPPEQLAAEAQVEEIRRELLPHFADPRDLGAYLVEIDWLTRFQKQTIFDGDWSTLGIGPYLVLNKVGEGGASEVFKAWDTTRGTR